MIRKLLICPWLGDLPSFYEKWLSQRAKLEQMGYDIYLSHDLNDFRARAFSLTGIAPKDIWNTRKLCDWRALFGLMYEEEIKGYDFWGFTDADCIYGRIDKWVTDEFLNSLDVHSNHHSYICGPWTLFRNSKATRDLFLSVENWRDELRNDALTGWVETSFSRALEKSGLRYQYTFWQAKERNPQNLSMKDGALYEGDTEIMMYHFRDRKAWPI